MHMWIAYFSSITCILERCSGSQSAARPKYSPSEIWNPPGILRNVAIFSAFTYSGYFVKWMDESHCDGMSLLPASPTRLAVCNRDGYGTPRMG